MQACPSSSDLLQAVAEFLREQALPELQGTAAFQSRVAARLVDIVIRDLNADPVRDSAQVQSLRALLGREDGTLEDLNQTLCERIAAGQMDLQTPGLARYLWRVTLDQLAVDQPGYDAHLRLATAAQAGH